MVEVTKQNGKTNSRGTLLAMLTYVSSQGISPVLGLKQKKKRSRLGNDSQKWKKRIESKIRNLRVNISM